MAAERRLSGRVALVTGGGRGIGRAIALRLAKDGADVMVNYQRDQTAAEEVVAAARALGVRARAIQATVASFEDCARLVAETVAAFGSLDILVNNAGIASRGQAVVDTDPADLERVMAVHAYGPFYLCKLAAPHLRKAARSDVIFISSTGSSVLWPNTAPYAMGKSAAEALALVFAKEEQAYGVRVNVIKPSLTVTEMGDRLSKAVFGVADIHELDKTSPFGRVSTPQDIASLVAFLVSPENYYISGQRISVDAGAGDSIGRP